MYFYGLGLTKHVTGAISEPSEHAYVMSWVLQTGVSPAASRMYRQSNLDWKTQWMLLVPRRPELECRPIPWSHPFARFWWRVGLCRFRPQFSESPRLT